MNNTLVEAIQGADGRYLSDQELLPFNTFVQSFAARLRVYQQLTNNGQPLVLNALRRVIQTKHRKVIQDHGPECQRDMLYTLDCIAKAVLLDDLRGFIDSYVVWMQNITRALHKEESAVEAYRALQAEIKATLGGEDAVVVNVYLNQLIEAIVTGI